MTRIQRKPKSRAEDGANKVAILLKEKTFGRKQITNIFQRVSKKLDL